MSILPSESKISASTSRRKNITAYLWLRLATPATIAYAALDLAVGLVFTVVSMLTIDLLLWRARQPLATRPFTYYAAVAYPIGGILGIILRFGLRW